MSTISSQLRIDSYEEKIKIKDLYDKVNNYIENLLEELCYIVKLDAKIQIKLYNITNVHLSTIEEIKQALNIVSNTVSKEKIHLFYYGIKNDDFIGKFNDYIKTYYCDKENNISFDRNGLYIKNEQIDIEYQFYNNTKEKSDKYISIISTSATLKENKFVRRRSND